MSACDCSLTCPLHEAAPEMRALLAEYAQRGADIVEPSAVSLIGQTRRLLEKIGGER